MYEYSIKLYHSFLPVQVGGGQIISYAKLVRIRIFMRVMYSVVATLNSLSGERSTYVACHVMC